MKRLLSPTRVTPPERGSFVVPVLMVTASRMVLSDPMTSCVGSLAYFKSCGGEPTTACGCTTLRFPSVVCPTTVAWLSNLHPAPSVTCGPTTQNGPTSTSSASCAPGSTTARG